MRLPFRVFSLLCASGLMLGACGRTTVGDVDVPEGGVTDTGTDVVIPPNDNPNVMPDVGPDVQADARMPRCGDGTLDPGESCDDNNNAPNDGCDPMCNWEARCGDRNVDVGEVCDDGNNRSGDGCRSDCGSNEMCGNGIVDTHVGELCDGTPDCAPGCRAVLTCGNGAVESPETCDDRNLNRWDGCGPDCRVEQGIGLNAFFIAADNGRVGCDFTGDGRPDNTFGRGLGPATGLLNTAITNGISNGQLLLQLAFLGLDDATGVNDDNVRVGFLPGTDADGDMLNNNQPGNPRLIQRGTLDMMGLPLANFQGAISMLQLNAGPEDIQLNLPGPMGMPFNFRVTRGYVSGTLQSDGMRITGLTDGQLCGAIPTRDLAALPNFFAFSLMGGGGGGMSRSTFLEALVGGFRITIPLFGSLNIGPVQPDVDLDGDGLERFEATPGNAMTPPQITACIDGDGTRITGRMCAMDPRMADGFTAAFQHNGVFVSFVGVR